MGYILQMMDHYSVEDILSVSCSQSTYCMGHCKDQLEVELLVEAHIPEGVQLEAEGLSLFHRGKIFCRVSPSFQPQRLFSSFLRIILGWTKEMSIQKAHP